MPLKFKDLPVTVPITQINPNHRNLIMQLNRCFWSKNILPEGKSQYLYLTGTIKTDILDLPLKNLYKNQISLRKVDMKWVDKCKKYYVFSDEMWEDIWTAIHDPTNSYKIQSAMWEMMHLNYYCAYKAFKYYNEVNRCKLCGEAEADSFHIILSCPVHIEVFQKFNGTYREIDGKDITERESIFGVQDSGNKSKLRNFLTFIIKNSIFRMRNVNFATKRLAITGVLSRIRKDIRNELNSKLLLYLSRNRLPRFRELFLHNNVLGQVVNNTLVFTLDIV